jgi:hypothetical protein
MQNRNILYAEKSYIADMHNTFFTIGFYSKFVSSSSARGNITDGRWDLLCIAPVGEM